MDVTWELVIVDGEGWVMVNQSLIVGFWCSPLLPLCKVELLDRKLKRAKKKKIKKIGLQQQEKQTISPQELTGNSLHSFQWIVLVWWQHNNSQTGDKPIKRNTLKNRWKAVLHSHLSYKNMRGCFARSVWSVAFCGLKRSMCWDLK